MDDVLIHKDPYGVVLVMGAWNYPLQLTLLPVVGAIAAGNSVVIKPSEIAPATAKIIAELIPKYLNRVKKKKTLHFDLHPEYLFYVLKLFFYRTLIRLF